MASIATGAVTLVRAAHALPCVAVTVFATLLGVIAGNTALTCVLLAVAVLAGQLLIGWTNDRLDASADRQAGRVDKPLAVGQLGTAAVDVARIVALLGTVAASLALGWRAGVLHLVAVASGVAYDARLKRTRWSWLPYAFSFGSLPAIATLATPSHERPGAWVLVAAALLGIAAHLTNALPDLDADLATGMLGLPTRLGARPSLALATVLLGAATLVIAFGPAGTPRWWSWAGLAVTVLLGAAAAGPMLRRAETRAAFRAVIAFVPVDLAMVIVIGTKLR